MICKELRGDNPPLYGPGDVSAKEKSACELQTGSKDHSTSQRKDTGAYRCPNGISDIIDADGPSHIEARQEGDNQ